MINTDSHYRTINAYNNNGTDVLSHYSDTLSPTAHITHIQVCATLSALMCYQATLMSKCLITQITGIWTLTTCICLYFIRLYCWINALLHTLEEYGSSPPTLCWCVTSLFWCLITHITGIWMYTTMYALMCYQVTLLAECLTTHYTIWMLTTMYVLIRCQLKVLAECLMTYKNTRINNYVCVDVLSGYSVG